MPTDLELLTNRALLWLSGELLSGSQRRSRPGWFLDMKFIRLILSRVSYSCLPRPLPIIHIKDDIARTREISRLLRIMEMEGPHSLSIDSKQLYLEALILCYEDMPSNEVICHGEHRHVLYFCYIPKMVSINSRPVCERE